MIEDPKPSNWKDLQSGVCKILNEVGISAELEQKIKTPRGSVEIDVYGVDRNSVEQIKYIIECKNWGKPVAQHVVHSFTTVLQETGGHIGILVSKEGFQEGARSYINNTNIVAFTYAEFQQRYFKLWYKKYFCPKIFEAIDTFFQYIEPINSRRSRHVEQLSKAQREEYYALCSQYEMFGIVMAMLSSDKFAHDSEPSGVFDIEEFKRKTATFGEEFQYQSNYYRDLIDEISQHSQSISQKFHTVFGGDIFA
ncbi:restriction endonuclease [Vibrio parahaemolyticus]|uniref:restriction endonuclease n=1 Tax=Vibrio parahaemolyticus TaxID=670 RepID=UPI001E288CF4|nr:restriction endonuclease [Vibrio parahaemolyticus]ELB2044435.1 restriction endonuclease [Vibrio parahaemolyticus]